MNDKKCDEFIKSGWTINPKTGRKITPSGRVAKQLREECGFTMTAKKPAKRVPTKAECEAIRARPGVNPLTGRTLLVGGPTHRKLLRECEVESALRRVMRYSGSPSPKKPVVAKTKPAVEKTKAKKSVVAESAPRSIPSRSCTERGFMQISSTCWFNSVLNALCMGDATGVQIRKAIERLPKSVLEGFRASGEKAMACPIAPGKSHVLKYAYRYFAGLDHMMTPTKRDRPRSAVRAVMASPEQRSIRKIGENRGFHSQRATGAILGSFFDKDEYAISDWKDIKKIPASARVVSFQEPSKKGVHYYLHDAFTRRSRPKSITIGSRKYKLSSAVLSMVFENGVGHAVAVYTCRGRDYLYDSNMHNAVYLSWTNGIGKTERERLETLYGHRYGKIREAHFSLELFARV
jgi:hypothetical protein